MLHSLREARLIDASVARTGSFLEAATALAGAGLSAIAVVDERRRVVGLFREDDLVAALFPPYLRELRHTAFTRDIEDALFRRGREASAESIAQHMSEPVTLDLETSATHAAERFLHVPWGSLAVVEDERFIGMLSEIDFARWMLARLELL